VPLRVKAGVYHTTGATNRAAVQCYNLNQSHLVPGRGIGFYCLHPCTRASRLTTGLLSFSRCRDGDSQRLCRGSFSAEPNTRARTCGSGYSPERYCTTRAPGERECVRKSRVPRTDMIAD